MKMFSRKRTKRNRESKQLRQQLIRDYGFCMCCDATTTNRYIPAHFLSLCCHEIAGGPHREAFLDQPCGILVVCLWCNGNDLEDHSLWPRAKQLALIKQHGGGYYDLGRWCGILGREEVEEGEVEFWRGVMYPGEEPEPCEGCPEPEVDPGSA